VAAGSTRKPEHRNSRSEWFETRLLNGQVYTLTMVERWVKHLGESGELKDQDRSAADRAQALAECKAQRTPVAVDEDIGSRSAIAPNHSEQQSLRRSRIAAETWRMQLPSLPIDPLPVTSFANRRNALRSTGPTTENGKRRSRQNAIRHGLSAETVVEIVEDIEDYRGFEAAIIADYDARTAVERELVRPSPYGEAVPDPHNQFFAYWSGGRRDTACDVGGAFFDVCRRRFRMRDGASGGDTKLHRVAFQQSRVDRHARHAVLPGGRVA
jgi:hypothetical protein